MLFILKIFLSLYITDHYVSATGDLIQSISNSEANPIEPRILYGDNAKIEKYPFYAGLNNCGAVIISNIWILTAAHCVEDVTLNKNNFVWVGGETFASSIKVPYYKIHIHQGYRDLSGTPINDIALLKLSHHLQFNKKIQPIRLPKQSMSYSKTVFVGRGTDETGHISKTLKKVDLIKLSTTECLKLIPKEYQATDRKSLKTFETSILCAKREGNMPSICWGDSGSPLVSGGTVVGLASFIGHRKCENAMLGFYVNVTSYVPWIKAITGLR